MPTGRSLRACVVGSLGFLMSLAGCGEPWVAPMSNPLPVGDEPQFGGEGGAGGQAGGTNVGGMGGAGGTGGGGLPATGGDCIAEAGPPEVVKVGTPGKLLLVGC